jgi:hypothetical protein
MLFTHASLVMSDGENDRPGLSRKLEIVVASDNGGAHPQLDQLLVRRIGCAADVTTAHHMGPDVGHGVVGHNTPAAAKELAVIRRQPSVNCQT